MKPNAEIIRAAKLIGRSCFFIFSGDNSDVIPVIMQRLKITLPRTPETAMFPWPVKAAARPTANKGELDLTIVILSLVLFDDVSFVAANVEIPFASQEDPKNKRRIEKRMYIIETDMGQIW